MRERLGVRLLWGGVLVVACAFPLWAQEPANVAPNGVALQSTTLRGGFFGNEAAGAIDGLTTATGCTDTSITDFGDSSPTWEVDLGNELDIQRIVIWNCTDVCADCRPSRLTNFRVSVLNLDGDVVFEDEYFPEGTAFPDPADGGFEISINGGVVGNIVRIQLLDTHEGFDADEFLLGLAEVEVFAVEEGAPVIREQPEDGRSSEGRDFSFSVRATGTEPFSYQWEKDEVAIGGATSDVLSLADLTAEDAGEYSVVITNAVTSVTSSFAALTVTPPNLALCGDASQSSTFLGAGASRTIDGAFIATGTTVSHTNLGDPLPWMEIRLAEDSLIEGMVLWNRSDCCQERLSNFTVSILDAVRTEVQTFGPFFTDGSFPGDSFEIPNVGVVGRIVRLEKAAEDVTGGGLFISLGEFEIFGEEVCTPLPEPVCPEPGSQGFGDTSCNTISVEGPENLGTGDYLVTGRGTDASGDVLQYHFSAVHRGRGTTVTAGPQPVRWAFLPLTFGTWDVSVTVDDLPQCEDLASNATCTQTVEVIDAECIPGAVCNVAVRGFATQSSTFFFDANIAIDGNTSGDNSQDEITHTGFNDSAPTWEVELDDTYDIQKIVLWNRTDCCPQRLTNFSVFVLDENRKVLFEENFFPEGTGFPDPIDGGFEVEIGGLGGRFVQVALNDTHDGFNPGDFFLSLAEVQVFAQVSTPMFRRGDPNLDGGADLSDGVFTLNHLFVGGPAPLCPKSADSDDSGSLDLSDPVFLLNHLFLGGPIPPEPFAACGVDLTPDPLECPEFPPCP